MIIIISLIIFVLCGGLAYWVLNKDTLAMKKEVEVVQESPTVTEEIVVEEQVEEQ